MLRLKVDALMLGGTSRGRATARGDQSGGQAKDNSKAKSKGKNKTGTGAAR